MRLFDEKFHTIRLQRTQFFGNLTVIPIAAELKSQRDDIKTFDELASVGLAEAAEISESGSVNTIRILNKSESYLAIFDNDIIIGAKQNRVAKSTVLVPPHEAINLPVYCVERGRWHYENSLSFHRSEHSISPLMREKKMMMMKAGTSANIQHEVWSDVDALSQKLAAFSPTDDYTEVVSRQRYRGESDLVDFIKNCKGNGYIVANGNKMFAEIYYDQQTCRCQSLKSIKSWLADLTSQMTTDARSNTLIETELMNSLWHRVRSIGVETTYEASGAKQGQSVLLEGSFVHGLIYL